MLLSLVVSVEAEGAVAVAPVFIDLDKDVEVDALAEELLECLAGFGGDALEGYALVTDDDALLTVALDVDDRGDADVAVGLPELLHDDLAGVGYLLVVVEEYLLAHDLGDEETGGLVGPLVLVEVGGMVGQELTDALEYVIDVEAVEGRDGEYLGLGQCLVPEGDRLFQRLLVREVYLVDEHEDGHPETGYLLEEIGVLVGGLHHVGDVEQDVGIHQCALGELEHLLLQFVVGLEHPGGVGEAYLHVGGVEDAHDAVARGLRLEGGNADALTHEEIHECALPHIGIADDVYETRLVHFIELRTKSEERRI